MVEGDYPDNLAGIFICCSILADAQTTRFQQVELLDARTWDFSNRLPLRGNWSVIHNKLVPPQAIENENLTTAFFPAFGMTTGPTGGALATQPMRWMYSFRILSVRWRWKFHR